MERRSFVIGIILVGLGALLLARNFNLINIYWEDLEQYWRLWPWLLVIGGALFWLGWAKNRQETGLLMPGTILLVYGLLFWYSGEYGWRQMGDYNLWAFFLIGPGLGFLMMYLLGRRDRGHLIPAAILLGLGILFLAGWNRMEIIWPIILILIGLRLVWKYFQKQQPTP